MFVNWFIVNQYNINTTDNTNNCFYCYFIGFCNMVQEIGNSFVSIKVFFNSNQERTINHLSSIYNNEGLIYESVKELVRGRLQISDIKGKRILLKPNWVKHCVGEFDPICLCTNNSVTLALVKYLLEYEPASIIIGDAPIQGCDWDKLMDVKFETDIKELSKNSNIPIIIKDFRKVTFDPSTNKLVENRNPDDNYLIFDVGSKSYLEEITSPDNTFRVTCYNPDRLALSHHKGVHKYCIIKDVFECDTIITIPKIKTHQKSGITNSLKILVGINGDKDYLPHHRIGAEGHGGDCYKGWHPLRQMSELVLDAANRRRGKKIYTILNYLSAGLWRLSMPNPAQNLAAGWYGNDTVWRMVLDLNMVAIYGKTDGSLSDTPQRTLYTLCDGIIGGQGNGPLSPLPLPLGVLAFSNDPYAMDEAAGILFNMNISRIPLLREAACLNKEKTISYYVDNEKTTKEALYKYSTDVIMPPGWVDYNKNS